MEVYYCLRLSSSRRPLCVIAEGVGGGGGGWDYCWNLCGGENYYVSLFRFSDFSGVFGPQIAIAGVVGEKFKWPE